MEFALISALLLLSAIGVFGQSSSANNCSWYGIAVVWCHLNCADNEEPTAVLNDIAIPYVLSQVIAYYPTSCSNPIIATEYWWVIIDDSTFSASPEVITFTNPLTDGLVVTRTFLDVTITSLSPGQILTYVSTQIVEGILIPDRHRNPRPCRFSHCQWRIHVLPTIN